MTAGPVPGRSSGRRSPQPDRAPPPPVVARIRVRYAKRGPLRFASHRDLARALERGLRRAVVPMAFSAGFSPHPRISYLGAAPTGAASEAEYLELALAADVDPAALASALDAALPPGLDILDAVAVPAAGAPSLADRIEASHWQLELSGTTREQVLPVLDAFLALTSSPVQRRASSGLVMVDTRRAVVSLTAREAPRAILDLVVRHETPAVRPDDVLEGLRNAGPLGSRAPLLATRLAQGPLGADGQVGDPLAADRAGCPG